MPALTTIIAGASLAAGVAGAVVQNNAQKKALNQQKQEAAKQETAALEAASLKGQDMQDARIKIGADATSTAAAAGSNKKGTSVRTTATGVGKSAVFAGSSASNIGGL